MYKKVDTSLNLVDREKEILKFWKDNKIFEKTFEKGQNKPVFTFYDGPPTANGKPHIGHILTRVIKDIIPRYKVMKGFSVMRKAGWDTHGLPVELEVEKSLKLDGKQDIEKYGIEPFIKKCKESVWKYKGEWEKMSDRVAFWADMENPYITYDNNYIESEWWALKKIYEKGLLYKGHKIVPYCPRCGTSLSSHEVAQGYKDVKELSIFVCFKAKNAAETYFLAWTTTPWTLPSNVALCVNPKEDYAKVLKDGKYYILAKNLVDSLFEKYEIVDVKKGKEYEFSEYEPLFDYAKEVKEKAWYVTCDNFVTLSDGSGIVHIAPAFGEDDSLVGKKYNLPFVQLVDDRGNFKPQAKELAGTFAKKADKLIIENLKNRGLLFAEKMYEHSYPYCWRCDTPLLYYARSTWFIRITALKEHLIKNNNSVNWMPDNIKSGRMGNFLENVIDWGLSRERYWGTPLPVWICGSCGKIHVVGSRKELDDLSGCGADTELHRPYIDAVTFKCDCGGTFKRTPEVIDCWFDSGAMPFAQHHYPFENKDIFEKNFPADFISEAIDQTRGWFYTLLAISTLLFDKSPFKNCIVLGHVNDKNGIKMSKHKGNVIDPWAILDKQGADAVRWYFYTVSDPWVPSRFYAEAVDEAQRKFMGTLLNTYAFFVLYAEIDKYNPKEYSLKKCKLSVMDRWILSELNTLIKNTERLLDEYNITDSARNIQDFTDRLSNWYVRRCRERYWGKDMTDDKAAAYTTLYTVLVTLSKVIAPYVPFMAESIYQNLVKGFFDEAPLSVHLTEFPSADESFIDAELESNMESVLDIVALGRAARAAVNIKNRQPLSKIYVAGGKELPDKYREVILDELNIKNYENVASVREFTGYEIKPQLKTLGPKYGKLIGAIREYLASCNANDIVDTVNAGKIFKTEIGGVQVEFALEDLLISPRNKEGFASASDKGLTVVLDTALSDELICEGVARELVSKIQTMRKEAGFEVVDRINVYYKAAGNAKKVLENNLFNIKKDVLANNIIYSNDLKGTQWDINGEQAEIKVEKVNQYNYFR
jgi:isoleucyl-tRNA synthetase